jgi:hypothetical protein
MFARRSGDDVGHIQVSVGLGDITPDEAAKEISDTLGLNPAQAVLLGAILDGLEVFVPIPPAPVRQVEGGEEQG